MCPDGLVRNLEVDGTNTYVVDGVVVHNCHHLGAPYFNITAPLGKGLRWGLSATVDRDDGMGPLYQYHIGPILYQNLENEVIPEVYFVRTNTALTASEMADIRDRTGEVNIPKLLTLLSEDNPRNSEIAATLNVAIGEGRKILVLSSRVEHLKLMHSYYKDKGAGLIHGEIQGKEREGILQNHDLIFATTQLAKEGLDRKDLDTIAILLPITKEGMFRQILGRIQRSCKGKLKPVVLVFEDSHIPSCTHMCRKLRSHLTALQYPFSIT